MSLVYAGFDEAGYGPMLGPLCVGGCALRVHGWSPGEPAPDVWEALAPVLCRDLRSWRKDPRGRLPVADSKKLKLSNQSKTRHPLMHLERGVLAFLHTAGTEPATDDELFAVLGSDLGSVRAPWFGGEPCPLPLGNEAHDVSIVANLLRSALARAGIELLWLGVRAVAVTEFNAVVQRTGTKASTTAMAMAEQLRQVEQLVSASCPDATLRLVCDRLGGRQKYSGVVQRTFPDGEVRVIEESASVSRYALTLNGRESVVSYQPEAEDRHLPVALASMSAKLVRELAMARMNRYWAGRVSELKPTAGYVSDARRWLADVGREMSEQERALMVRSC